MCAAWITCISRVVDYQHTIGEVIGGVILGAILAVAFTLLFGRSKWNGHEEES